MRSILQTLCHDLPSKGSHVALTSVERALHISVVLQPLRESPSQKEHVKLVGNGVLSKQEAEQVKPLTWNTRSTRSEIIKATFRLENPAAQKVLGRLPVEVVCDSATVASLHC